LILKFNKKSYFTQRRKEAQSTNLLLSELNDERIGRNQRSIEVTVVRIIINFFIILIIQSK